MARFHPRLLAALATIIALGPASSGLAQNAPARMRAMDHQQPEVQPATSNTQAASSNAQPSATGQAKPAPSAPAASSVTAATLPASLLQEPAEPAKIVFSGNSLTIHANNSSLTSILRQIAAKNGMRIEGLDADERVFGNFGPGAPSDVLADLLNGTAYNVVLLGDLASGGELILTPIRPGSAMPSPPAQSIPPPDEVSNETPEEPPQQPEAQPPVARPVQTPGVRTPQQLFQQLQRMRDAQQQQQPQ